MTERSIAAEPVDGIPMRVAALADAIDTGALTPTRIVETALARIETLNPLLKAVLAIDADGALEAAAAADQRAAADRRLSRIDGIPFIVKDNIDVEGLITTNGLVSGPVADGDAPVVSDLRARGAIPIAKANMHEGALGATSANPHHGAVQNPVRLGWTPGGSSGGSAAVVAAGIVPFALGTDTMGSVRIPASYCGIVGYKPSRDVLSTDRVMPLASSFDHVGVLAWTTADVAMVLGRAMPSRPPKGVRAARLSVFDTPPMAQEITTAFGIALDYLEAAGVTIERAVIPGFDPAAARRLGLIVCEVDASIALRPVRIQEPEIFSAEFESFLAYGDSVTPSRYMRARRDLERLSRAINSRFRTVDILISPTAPQTSFPHEEAAPNDQAQFTGIANFMGAPAISLPLPVAVDGMPIGLHLISAPGTDDDLLGFANTVESFICPRP